MNEVEPSIWSHSISNIVAQLVLGISDVYLSIVSNAKLTNSSG